MSGITDGAGTFMYHEGESITFLVGDIMLGSAPGNFIMTPIDLVPGAVDETHPTVTNICRLLQSLDQDGNLATKRHSSRLEIKFRSVFRSFPWSSL